MNAIHPHGSTLPPFYRLDPHQQLLVSAMRHWSENAPLGPAVAEPLFRLFGLYYIEVALEAFEVLMQMLADAPRQPPTLLAPTSRQVSRGERTLLQLVNAFQADETVVAHACASTLTGPQNTRELLAATSVLAEALDARRIVFRLRDDKPLALMAVVGRG
jgi:hypothetical protein